MFSAQILHPPPAFIGKSKSNPGDRFWSATSDVAMQRNMIQQAPAWGRRLSHGAWFVNSTGEQAAAVATC